eukprot:5110039-Pyramimonas_sp.AAC.1
MTHIVEYRAETEWAFHLFDSDAKKRHPTLCEKKGSYYSRKLQRTRPNGDGSSLYLRGDASRQRRDEMSPHALQFRYMQRDVHDREQAREIAAK